jgi:hypothetical protein
MPNDPASAKDGQKILLAGKYESVEAFEQGHQNLQGEAQRLKARMAQLEAENRALQLSGQQAPSQGDVDHDAVALGDAGIDTAALDRYIAKRAQAAADAGVDRKLAPLASAAAAQQAIPVEMQTRASELLTKDQETAETYQALIDARQPARAANYLVGQIRAHDAEAGMRSEDKAVKEGREKNRGNAALPATQLGSPGDGDAEAAEAAAARRQVLLNEGIRRGGVTKAIASEFMRGKITVIDRLDKPPRVID